VALLVNPTSGMGRGARAARAALTRMRELGLSVNPMAGRDGAEAAAMARQAVSDGYDAIVAVGGDGMLHLVLQAVAGTDTPLGLIPAGSGNDFAMLLGLDPHRVEAAAEVVARWNVRTVDAGRVGESWFAGVLSSGFDSAVNERANRMTWPKGRMRYNLAILAELRTFRALPFRLVLDGVSMEREAMLVAIGNGVSYGGGMRICPGAQIDDGLLAVTVLEKISKPEFLRVFPTVYQGRHIEHPAVSVHEARHVELVADGAIAYADGERIAALPVSAEVVPGALRVLSP